MVVPVAAFRPTFTQEQAILKLIQNPRTLAVSPSGNVGSIGPGVGSGGTTSPGTAVPAQPFGLTASTGIDNIAQVNNAYVQLSWSASPFVDFVVDYAVRWRKSTDPETPASYYRLQTSETALKIGNLFQGVGYTFEVAAVNSAHVQSSWSVIGVTAGLDTGAPPAPTGFRAFLTPRGAALEWSGNSATDGDLQGYVLEVAIASGPTATQGFVPLNQAPMLATSYVYTAPSGTDPGTVLTFEIAAVDWSGNQSAWATAVASPTDSVYFDELGAGALKVYGEITTGGLTTRSDVGGVLSGTGVDVDSSGVTLNDGTGIDHGAGPGITAKLDAQTGDAFRWPSR